MNGGGQSAPERMRDDEMLSINVALEIETNAAYEVMPAVLEAQRRALESREEVPASVASETPVGDDFDPFLDTDETLP